jgi:hypothetical protein
MKDEITKRFPLYFLFEAKKSPSKGALKQTTNKFPQTEV